ncbi:hypothetical protein V5799_025812, partial [Amblyomma americanum]
YFILHLLKRHLIFGLTYQSRHDLATWTTELITDTAGRRRLPSSPPPWPRRRKGWRKTKRSGRERKYTLANPPHVGVG